ncbi:benzoate 4-monooxygenase cytochrome P450 [Aspergillus steynii IBT 23096]|uniref:Benzoate 4-monooxygenase cytochrome P450 n=1 Tax=Aspergillus steynii IBT 23096 TaxID=1392250 RepID=A0A2I2GEU6_9EURO|nr:benzoate 4-monooxygenase cytochrome P450 [Aspergillus steynii IBT 23096]PLB51408.1 benzoate 4-monooxygenase cytochrome P450 [Aspergillus steynii IBT 23096]
MLYGIIIASITILYAACTVAYRLFLHPLAKFPGPKLAAASKWYEAYFDLMKGPGGQFMHEINRMHDIYGPIVRINPDELHVKDSSWFDTLYCGPATGKRNKYKAAAHMTGTPDAIFGTVEHETHRRRRAAISPFFSKAMTTSVEPLIYNKVKELCKTVQYQVSHYGHTEMRTNFLAFATDTVCEHTFADVELCLLQSERKANDWKKTIYTFTWILPIALKLPLDLLRKFFPSVAGIAEFRVTMEKKARQATRRSRDHTKLKTSDHQLDLFDSILSSKSIPTDDKYAQRIAQEGFVVVVAAGETTARMLTNALYHVLANRRTVLPELQRELTEAIPDPNTRVPLARLEKLPWLTAVIRESLRITALVASRLPLVCPDEPLAYRNWIIPSGTPIGMTLRDVLLDPSIFDGPSEFQPQRWIDTPSNGLEWMQNAYVPFGRGSRMCVGLNFAHAELYLCLGYLFRISNLDLHNTTRRDVEITRDCFIGEVSAESKGIRVKFFDSPSQDPD